MDDMWLGLIVDGEEVRVSVTGVGGTVRVAVGEVGLRSSVWRIWANPATSDVYAGASTLLGHQKFSLHQSGVWRYAWTETSQLRPDAAGDRVIDRWQPKPPDRWGWIPAISIMVGAEDVTRVPADVPGKKTHWLPKPSVGMATGIHLVFVKPDSDWAPLDGMAIVDVLRLANGQGMVVMSNTRQVTPVEQAVLAEGRTSALAQTSVADLLGTPGMRLGLFCTTDDGHRVVWDTALEAARGLPS